MFSVMNIEIDIQPISGYIYHSKVGALWPPNIHIAVEILENYDYIYTLKVVVCYVYTDTS